MSIEELKKERKMQKKEEFVEFMKCKARELFLEAYDGDFMSISEFVGGVLLLTSVFLIIGVFGEIELSGGVTSTSIALLAISGGYMLIYALVKLFFEN